MINSLTVTEIYLVKAWKYAQIYLRHSDFSSSFILNPAYHTNNEKWLSLSPFFLSLFMEISCYFSVLCFVGLSLFFSSFYLCFIVEMQLTLKKWLLEQIRDVLYSIPYSKNYVRYELKWKIAVFDWSIGIWIGFLQCCFS